MLITPQAMSKGWAFLVPLDLILRHLPLGLQTKFSDDALCVVILFSCMHVCVCVFDFGYHYALLYQGFSVERVIFLDISSCSEPKMRAKQILRESIWSNSNTAPAAVDLSISLAYRSSCGLFYNLQLLHVFLIDHQDGGIFKLRHLHSLPPCYLGQRRSC